MAAKAALIPLDPSDPNYDPAQTYFEATVRPDNAKLGMKYVKTEIVSVVPGGWAQSAGVEVDDEIFEIAGQPVSAMTEKEKHTALTKTPKPFVIRFKRPLYKDTYFSVECNESKLGFKYNYITITSVVAGGWAEKNGVERGDQLIEVRYLGGMTMSLMTKLTLAGFVVRCLLVDDA